MCIGVYSVQLTPTGFKKVNNSPTPHKTNQLWMLGSNVGKQGQFNFLFSKCTCGFV